MRRPSRHARADARHLLLVLPLLTLGAVDCYSQGDGTAPPKDSFYFPVGLAVSANGSVLYAANSDFDLQYNGGTIQSYDLRLIRHHALAVIGNASTTTDPVDHTPIPYSRPPVVPDAPVNPCDATQPPVYKDDGSGGRQPLGETCAPPVRSQFYFRSAVVVGAFATDLLLSKAPDRLAPQAALSPATARCGAGLPACPAGTACFGAVGTHAGACEGVGSRAFDRVFVPVRGNASVTWARVARDAPDAIPPLDYPATPYAPFDLDCKQGPSGRCAHENEAGTDPDSAPEQNTRHLTMPGEPFGATLSEDGESLLVTHQADTKTSLFSTGLARGDTTDAQPPALEFILDGLPYGGIGITPVPHDRDAFDALTYPRPAFLETTRAAAEVDLLRRYPDEGSSLHRPFLDRELVFPITPTAGGTDSRGIVVDPTPRLACKARVAAADPLKGRTQDAVDKETVACARKPARVFIANRSPASLLVGDIGGDTGDGSGYDPDRLTLHTTIPLTAGPSKLYLAPIVDRDGAYALRVFVVCFDSAQIFVYDPDAQQIENTIRVGPGPFAMAFDPFRLEDVATNQEVPIPGIEANRQLRAFRFAYVASFTQSYVQLIDLDDAQANRSTFERIVFTLGTPTNPKGT